jgi:hypothetical protein
MSSLMPAPGSLDHAGFDAKDPAEPGGGVGVGLEGDARPGLLGSAAGGGSSKDLLAGLAHGGELPGGSLSCTPSTTLGKRTPQERDGTQEHTSTLEDTMRRLEERYALIRGTDAATKALAGAGGDSAEVQRAVTLAAAAAMLVRPQKMQRPGERTPGKGQSLAAETFATAIKGEVQAALAAHAEQSPLFGPASALQNVDDVPAGGIKPDGRPHGSRAASSASSVRMRAAAEVRSRGELRGRDVPEDMSDDYIRGFLKVEVSHESCNMIRLINTQLQALVKEGVARFVTSDEHENSVWGFRVLEVEDPLAFNRRFREVVPPGRDSKPLKRPTEVFMKMLRFCGVTARRGARGPRETDPDPRDFMYSFYYDYVSSKEEYNRRKLCTNGYSKEAREIAGQHKGEYLQGTLMPRRTKRASELKQQKQVGDEADAAAAAAAVAQLAATAASAGDGTSGGLEALFEAAVSELQKNSHPQAKEFVERNATLMGALLSAAGTSLGAVKNAASSSLVAAALQEAERGLEAPSVPPPPPSPSSTSLLPPALDPVPPVQAAVGADEALVPEDPAAGEPDKVPLCV